MEPKKNQVLDRVRKLLRSIKFYYFIGPVQRSPIANNRSHLKPSTPQRSPHALYIYICIYEYMHESPSNPIYMFTRNPRRAPSSSFTLACASLVHRKQLATAKDIWSTRRAEPLIKLKNRAQRTHTLVRPSPHNTNIPPSKTKSAHTERPSHKQTSYRGHTRRITEIPYSKKTTPHHLPWSIPKRTTRAHTRESI